MVLSTLYVNYFIHFLLTNEESLTKLHWLSHETVKGRPDFNIILSYRYLKRKTTPYSDYMQFNMSPIGMK